MNIPANPFMFTWSFLMTHEGFEEDLRKEYQTRVYINSRNTRLWRDFPRPPGEWRPRCPFATAFGGGKRTEKKKSGAYGALCFGRLRRPF